MHHQDICSILRIVDDYFLLTPLACYSIIRCKKAQADRSNAIVISRQLNNGLLEIEINGQHKDNDDVDFIYRRSTSGKEFDKKVQVNCNNFTIERVRQVVRDLIIYDANFSEVKPN